MIVPNYPQSQQTPFGAKKLYPFHNLSSAPLNNIDQFVDGVLERGSSFSSLDFVHRMDHRCDRAAKDIANFRKSCRLISSQVHGYLPRKVMLRVRRLDFMSAILIP